MMKIVLIIQKIKNFIKILKSPTILDVHTNFLRTQVY